ncbi:hypothetical protein FISHEDRAFT_59045 [Fistulina hepatica ATCC 64428]|uniref:Uncharacterized protein n=1 Tax=Fistulina hepatica ATCC 64428 TaxID=1128425 RepID=A0A0D7ACT5_9AGAR|nr:hypothetical protein FISHEDRAFT_59045 [Fistulina hepatica ATCC 64428]
MCTLRSRALSALGLTLLLGTLCKDLSAGWRYNGPKASSLLAARRVFKEKLSGNRVGQQKVLQFERENGEGPHVTGWVIVSQAKNECPGSILPIDRIQLNILIERSKYLLAAMLLGASALQLVHTYLLHDLDGFRDIEQDNNTHDLSHGYTIVQSDVAAARL